MRNPTAPSSFILDHPFPHHRAVPFVRCFASRLPPPPPLPSPSPAPPPSPRLRHAAPSQRRRPLPAVAAPPCAAAAPRPPSHASSFPRCPLPTPPPKQSSPLHRPKKATSRSLPIWSGAPLLPASQSLLLPVSRPPRCRLLPIAVASSPSTTRRRRRAALSERRLLLPALRPPCRLLLLPTLPPPCRLRLCSFYQEKLRFEPSGVVEAALLGDVAAVEACLAEVSRPLRTASGWRACGCVARRWRCRRRRLGRRWSSPASSRPTSRRSLPPRTPDTQTSSAPSWRRKVGTHPARCTAPVKIHPSHLRRSEPLLRHLPRAMVALSLDQLGPPLLMAWLSVLAVPWHIGLLML